MAGRDHRTSRAARIVSESDEQLDRGISGVSHQAGSGGSRHASNLVDIPVGATVEHHRDEGRTFTLFAAMPFDPVFDDVFFVAIRSAAHALGGRAVRVDQEMHASDAVAKTQELIRNCRAVVADLSTSEPDVLYELGIAHALGKPSVQICRTAYSDLPFMVRNRETLLYEVGRTHLLGQQLVTYLAGLFDARAH